VTEDEQRQRALELLEANHVFPTDFSVSVIARNEETVSAAVAAAASAGGASGPVGHERLPSAHAKYVSHRLVVRCASSTDVLELFARLRAVEGVVTVL
jgi:putative lipoic acid-binding regulatory protein